MRCSRVWCVLSIDESLLHPDKHDIEETEALTSSKLPTDVRLTKDSQLVVHHDPHMDRTTDFKGDIIQYTYEELKLVDAAHQYTPKGVGKAPYVAKDFPYRGLGYRIPLFSEFMDAFNTQYLNIEIKDNIPLAAELVWKELSRKPETDLSRIIVASGHCDVLNHFRTISGGVVATSACEKEGLAFFVTHKLGIGKFWYWLFPPTAVAYQAPVVSSGVWLNSDLFVKAAHRMDQKLMYWVINDAELARELLGLGCDGIVSDRPDIIYSVFHERKLVPDSLEMRLVNTTLNTPNSFYIPESNPREVHTCLSLGCKILPVIMNHFTELFLGIVALLALIIIRTNLPRPEDVAQSIGGNSSGSQKSPSKKSKSSGKKKKD